MPGSRTLEGERAGPCSGDEPPRSGEIRVVHNFARHEPRTRRSAQQACRESMIVSHVGTRRTAGKQGQAGGTPSCH